MKHTDELRDIRYEGLEWIKSIGRTVQRDNYDLVYTAPLTPGDPKGSVLDNLEYRFNNEHPADYRHPSMSVSDIVAIKQDGKVSCHYCDSFGFQQIPGFLPDNPLKSAEMTVEGRLRHDRRRYQQRHQGADGGPAGTAGPQRPAHLSHGFGGRRPPGRSDKKKSVMDQLKSQPKSNTKRQRPKRARKGRSDMNAMTFEETNLLCIYNPGSRLGASRP